MSQIKPGAEGRNQQGERRRRPRMPVHWTVLLAREPCLHAYEGLTRDLSSNGFYCNVSETFQPNEALECRLLVPTHAAESELFCLQAQVTVVRVDYLEPGHHGIACTIDHYQVYRLDAALDRDHSPDVSVSSLARRFSESAPN